MMFTGSPGTAGNIQVNGGLSTLKRPRRFYNRYYDDDIHPSGCCCIIETPAHCCDTAKQSNQRTSKQHGRRSIVGSLDRCHNFTGSSANFHKTSAKDCVKLAIMEGNGRLSWKNQIRDPHCSGRTGSTTDHTLTSQYSKWLKEYEEGMVFDMLRNFDLNWIPMCSQTESSRRNHNRQVVEDRTSHAYRLLLRSRHRCISVDDAAIALKQYREKRRRKRHHEITLRNDDRHNYNNKISTKRCLSFPESNILVMNKKHPQKCSKRHLTNLCYFRRNVERHVRHGNVETHDFRQFAGKRACLRSRAVSTQTSGCFPFFLDHDRTMASACVGTSCDGAQECSNDEQTPLASACVGTSCDGTQESSKDEQTPEVDAGITESNALDVDVYCKEFMLACSPAPSGYRKAYKSIRQIYDDEIKNFSIPTISINSIDVSKQQQPQQQEQQINRPDNPTDDHPSGLDHYAQLENEEQEKFRFVTGRPDWLDSQFRHKQTLSTISEHSEHDSESCIDGDDYRTDTIADSNVFDF